MKNNNHRSIDYLGKEQHELETANAAETVNVRAEITKIKRTYIKKHGMPKQRSTLTLFDIASENSD